MTAVRKIVSILSLSVLIAALLMAVAVRSDASEEHIHSICGDDGCLSHGESIVFTEWNDPDNLPERAGHYYLGCDVELNESWEPRADTVICLNGKVIRRNPSENTKFSMIRVGSNADLTVTDCGGDVSHGFSVSENGLYAYGGNDVVLSGGAITGGYAKDGAAVYVSDRGAFTLYDGNIVGNFVDEGSGGAVYVNASGNNKGVLTIHGGRIIGNVASSGSGGGIYSRGVSVIDGGEISQNLANSAGGVAVRLGELTVGGSAVVTENTANSSASNLYLYSGIKLSLSEVSAGCNIGITTANTPSEAANVIFTKDSTHAKSFAGCFIPDDPAYEVICEGSSLSLAMRATKCYSITGESSENGSFSLMIGEAIAERATEGERVRIVAAPDIGYMVTGISVSDHSGNSVTVDEDGCFIMPAADVSVSVFFAKIGAMTPSVEPGDSLSRVLYGYGEAYLSVKVGIVGDASDYTFVYKWYISEDEEGENSTEILGEDGARCDLPKGLNAGEYYLYCTVLATRVDNNESATGVSPLMKLTVERIVVEAPMPDEREFIYNGEEHIYEIAPDPRYTVSGNRMTAVSEEGYDVVISLCDPANYEWSCGGSEDIVYKFVIRKKQPTITLPTDSIVRVYGEALHLPLGRSDFGTVEIISGVADAPEVGEYEIIYAVSESENIAAAYFTLKLTVIKADYDMSGVSFKDKTVVADGEAHSLVIDGTLPDGVTVNYSISEVSRPGVYTIVASFGGDPNYNDIPSMSAVLTVKATEMRAEVGNTGIKLHSPSGVSPLASLLAEAVDLDDNEKLLAVLNTGERIGAAFDVRIMLGGETVQPDGEVYIYLPIPDADFETFRIFHIHGALFFDELEYTVEDGFAVVKVERLSYFAFIYRVGETEPPIDIPTEPGGDPEDTPPTEPGGSTGDPEDTPPTEPGDSTGDPEDTPPTEPGGSPEDPEDNLGGDTPAEPGDDPTNPPSGDPTDPPSSEPTDGPATEPSDTPTETPDNGGEDIDPDAGEGDEPDANGDANEPADELGEHLRAALNAIAEWFGRFDPVVLVILGIILGSAIIISFGIILIIKRRRKRIEEIEEEEYARMRGRIMNYSAFDYYNEEDNYRR